MAEINMFPVGYDASEKRQDSTNAIVPSQKSVKNIITPAEITFKNSVNSTNVGKNLQRLIFNRVPKCGGTTMQTLIQLVAHKNKFSIIGIHGPRKMTIERQFVQHGNHPGKSYPLHPMIYIKLSDATCIFTVLNFVSDHARHHDATPIITFDQPLWWKAVLIIKAGPEGSDLNNIVLRLRGVHAEMSLMGPMDESRFESPEPIYINLLRDPAERIISFYFFRRIPKNTKISDYNNKVEEVTKDFFKDYEARDVECSYIMNATDRGNGKLSIPFFCGHEDYCFVLGNRNALEQAKYVLDKKYTTVGITEHYNMSLIVLEKLLPSYFNGVVRIYNDENVDKNVIKRADVFKQVKKELKANMTIEYELYEFAKQRLIRQYNLLTV
ncbi:Heparan sulfate 2-O-sulfotransferase pipe [Nymphon striatum]|nr:Heparan sulfate 2-O-sulfotransferase pipe [Nymphon striatum]